MRKSRWIRTGGGAVLVAIVLSLCPNSARSQAPNNPPAPAVVQPLTDIKTVVVNVMINDKDNLLEGTQLKKDLREEQTKIELELRRAGIAVQAQGDCMLDVSVNVIGAKDICIISLTVTARRWVYLDQHQSLIAPVWSRGDVVWGNPTQLSSYFFQGVHACTDPFLDDYLAAKSASTPPSTQPVP